MTSVQFASQAAPSYAPYPWNAPGEASEAVAMRYLSSASASWRLTRDVDSLATPADQSSASPAPAVPTTTTATPAAPAPSSELSGSAPAGSSYNPNPDGVDLLVLDHFEISPEQAAAGAIASHGQQVSYVAASTVQGDVEINNLQVDELTYFFKQLRDIAESPNPPEVLNISLGLDACYVFEHDLQRYQDQFKRNHGDPSTWDDETWAKYKDDIGWVARASVNYFYESLVEGIPERLNEVLQQLVDVGVTVVLPAGNSGDVKTYLDSMGIPVPEGMFDGLYPAELPEGVIMVGASTRPDETGVHADFASPRGHGIDVAVDGTDILVSDRGDVNSGSSFAAPQVAALVADMKAKNPNLTPAQIEEIIHQTVLSVPDEATYFGLGMVDAEAALAQVVPMPDLTDDTEKEPPPPKPTMAEVVQVLEDNFTEFWQASIDPGVSTLITMADIEAVAADESASTEKRAAAQYVVDHPEFFRFLDTQLFGKHEESLHRADLMLWKLRYGTEKDFWEA